MAKLVAKTYGDALFELALEENKLDVFAEEITALAAAFNDNQELTDLMNHPKIVKEEKQQIMRRILKDRVSVEIVGFFNLIIAKDRYMNIKEILQYFMDMVKEHNNIGVAYVTTPMELRDSQKQQIEKRLLQTTKYEKIDIHYSVDRKLIGGMIIRIGDRVIDSSVRSKLYALTKDLTKIQLASI